MRIVFNLHQTGLGNNGGSRTLLKCGEVLSKLGAEVIMFSDIKCQFTWSKIRGVKHVCGDKSPSCDVMVATGVKSVKHTVRSQADKKFYYIRGFETWQKSPEKLFSSFRKLNCIVNSEWLRKKLSSENIKSHLIYQGVDFDKFYQIEGKRRIEMGALFNNRHETKRHIDAIEVSKSLGVSLKMLNKHIVNTNEDKLNQWYNGIKVWFAPTELEGLHNPPMEAALAGCALVCTDHDRNGMSDYAIHNKTAMVYPARDLTTARKCVKLLLEDEGQRLRINKGMRKILKAKIGSREHNMKKMLELFKS